MTSKTSIEHGGRFFCTFEKYMSLTIYSTRCQRGFPVTSNLFHKSRTISTSAESSEGLHHHNTHYSLFPHTLPHGPPPGGPFNIDLPALRREFLQLQSLAHPDRHDIASKARAEGTSARINDAYSTLLSPLRRAEYILSLYGIKVADDESVKTEDESLLIDVLDMRERIEEANTSEEIELLRSPNEDRIRKCEQDVAEALESGDWETGKKECASLRYWMGIQQAINDWEKGKPIILAH